VRAASHTFPQRAQQALLDGRLQAALAKARGGFVDKRRAALDELPEFEQLRSAARAVKEHTLSHLEEYLLLFERQVEESGGKVHWAVNPAEACAISVGLCRSTKARLVAKGKTMVGEEIGLNESLEAAGLRVIETDLGEYIIQLAGEPPSHIIAPAVHKSRDEIAELFEAHHSGEGLVRPLETVPDIVDEARRVLRDEFLAADVGITGANMLIAESGTTVLVTNEGNGDLTASLPPMHIVIASIEKVVPTLEDATVLLRLLARSATGQSITSYTSFFTGPKHSTDIGGPEQFHVVLVDNGRSEMLGNAYHDMLRCIRCGACLNHCPVYGAVGGHAYGWVYPGPMGAVLTPLMVGLGEGHVLADASTLCGRCEEVCPMSIPLPRLLREHRLQTHSNGQMKPAARGLLGLWAALARRPRLYRWLFERNSRLLHRLAGNRGYLRRLPLVSNWTSSRDLPAPQGGTFVTAWQRRHNGKATSR
jgi:L-lactate dehydrogenase complex protein LldF